MKLVKESISDYIEETPEVKSLNKYDFFIELLPSIPKSNQNLRLRFIQYIVFELTGAIKYKIPIKMNSSQSGKQLIAEHVLGKKTAAKKIAEYVDKHKSIDETKLKELLEVFGKYIEIPRYGDDINTGKKHVSINMSIAKYQNQEKMITYDEYVKSLQNFEVDGKRLIIESEELKKYMDNANTYVI